MMPTTKRGLKALAEVQRLAPREGWRYEHVQAIIVSIDQYAEAALGNREYFLNKPKSIGGGRNDHIPLIVRDSQELSKIPVVALQVRRGGFL
jgi:hypothetical protein